MKTTVVGTGYVGPLSDECIAHAGNDVVCLDLDIEKICNLEEGLCIFYMI